MLSCSLLCALCMSVLFEIAIRNIYIIFTIKTKTQKYKSKIIRQMRSWEKINHKNEKEEEEPRWWSRRTCSHSLLREHQNHN